MKVSIDKSKYEPTYKWLFIRFLVNVAKLGPTKAETNPYNKIIEIVVGIYFFKTLSAAANLYWAVNARPIPKNKFAKQ